MASKPAETGSEVKPKTFGVYDASFRPTCMECGCLMESSGQHTEGRVKIWCGIYKCSRKGIKLWYQAPVVQLEAADD